MGIHPIVAHAKYLINLASKDPEQRERSVQTLAEELSLAGRVGADLAVVHSGSHGGAGEEEGMKLLSEGLVEAWERADHLSNGGRPAEPVLENSVGAGTQLCYSFETLASAARGAGVRLCVDTAHAYVAGYDLSTSEGADGVGREMYETLGKDVALFHLNDAKNAFGSHRDGHMRIGEGMVPVSSWTALFSWMPEVPVTMETPYGTAEVDAEQVRLVKELAGGLPLSRPGV